MSNSTFDRCCCDSMFRADLIWNQASRASYKGSKQRQLLCSNKRVRNACHLLFLDITDTRSVIATMGYMSSMRWPIFLHVVARHSYKSGQDAERKERLWHVYLHVEGEEHARSSHMWLISVIQRIEEEGQKPIPTKRTLTTSKMAKMMKKKAR